MFLPRTRANVFMLEIGEGFPFGLWRRGNGFFGKGLFESVGPL